MMLKRLRTYVSVNSIRVLDKSREVFVGVLKDIKLLSVDDIELVLIPNIQITFDYLLLITSACVVSTLGLLMNSTPVIVGGMIISPLMWPIVGTSYALWRSKKYYLWRSLRLLGLSVLFTLFVSALLAYFSPIKVINDEILSRTTPTLFDLIVALASGAVAMLALTNARVSSSIAGVAIATSLLPPICVSGIGIAFFSSSIFFGGLLLFATNTVAIITIGLIYLILVSTIQNKSVPKIDTRGAVVICILIIVLAIPLKNALSQYGKKLSSVQKSRTVILREFKKIHPAISLISIQTNDQVLQNSHILSVDINIAIPQNVTISFDTKEHIRTEIESILNQPVDLIVRIQPTFAVLSEKEELYKSQERSITDSLRRELSKINQSIVIDSISVVKEKIWTVKAVLSLDPSNSITEKDRSVLESLVSKEIQSPVSLSLELIPRVKLNSDQDEEKNIIQKTISTDLLIKFPLADVVAISMGSEATSSASPSAVLSVQVRTPKNQYTPESLAEAIRTSLINIINFQYAIKLRMIPVEEEIFTQ